MLVNRRNMLGAMVSAPILANSPPTSLLGVNRAQSEPLNVVRTFGFVGDNHTDNYEAFHRWVTHVNRVGGGNYVFPPGSYFVARYRTTSFKSRDPNEVTNPHLFGCDGLSISGYGARLRLNGKFHRSARDYAIFMPFTLRQCRNVRIAGFELDGGVTDMSRDPGVKEAHAQLVGLHACSEVLLQDLDLHHCQTDGIYLGDDVYFTHQRTGKACRNVELKRVRCHNNARGGLAAIQVFGLTCIESSFNGNGYDLGEYRQHAPCHGVDVEPHHGKEGVDIDTKTGNITFLRCAFLDNRSALLAAYARKYKGHLRLIGCESSNRNDGHHHMIISWPGAVIDGGRHHAGEGTIWTCWRGQNAASLLIRDCEVLSSGPFGIFHAFDGNLLEMVRVKLTGTHDKAGSGSFPAIQANPGEGRHNLISNSHIFIPRARKSPTIPGDGEPLFNHCICSSNMFWTDLPAVGGQYFVTRYGPTTIVDRDRYRGTSIGVADSFRPERGATHDTAFPYSRVNVSSPSDPTANPT